jgi:hypothetical protein
VKDILKNFGTQLETAVLTHLGDPKPEKIQHHHPDCQCNLCSQDQYPYLKKDN